MVDQNLKNATKKPCEFCGFKLKPNFLKCPKCGRWNYPKPSALKPVDVGTPGRIDDDGTILLHNVLDQEGKRLRTGAWDDNFGTPPGLPDDAVILLGGEPGAGKSTIALQLSDTIAAVTKKETLYLCAEETKEQIKDRNVRLGLRSKGVRIVPLDRMGDTSLEQILLNRKFAAVVLDSIAGFTNDPEEAVVIVKSFKEFAALYRMPFIVINHINKSGDMAGMMKLQHAGDTSIMLSKAGDKEVSRVRLRPLIEEDEDEEIDDDEWFDVIELRRMKTEKNRYGRSGISSYYAMTEGGLVAVEREDDFEEEDEEEGDDESVDE